MLLLLILVVHLFLQLFDLVLELGEVGVFLDERECFAEPSVEFDQTNSISAFNRVFVLLVHDRAQYGGHAGHERLHFVALVDEEDEITMSVPVRLEKPLKPEIHDVVFGEDLAQLESTLPPDSRVVLLARVDAFDETLLRLHELLLRDHDQTFMKAQLLLENVDWDGEGAFSADMALTIEDNERIHAQRSSVVFFRALIAGGIVEMGPLQVGELV